VVTEDHMQIEKRTTVLDADELCCLLSEQPDHHHGSVISEELGEAGCRHSGLANPHVLEQPHVAEHPRQRERQDYHDEVPHHPHPAFIHVQPPFLELAGHSSRNGSPSLCESTGCGVCATTGYCIRHEPHPIYH